MAISKIKKQPEPLRRIAKGWLVLGLLGLAFLAAVAIAVFGFDVPVHDRSSGEILSHAEVKGLLAVMTMGCGIFAAAGAIILLMLKRPNS